MQVFYDPRQSVAGYESYSPSASKPEKVVAEWTARYPELVQIVAPTPVTEADLCLVHSPAYVRAVLKGARDNGFGDRDPRIAESCKWTCGSMVSATLAVLAGDEMMAVSPTSGFHHAGYEEGGGFCTFNGLALAANRAVAQGARVAILDADMHYGNGTQDILDEFRTDWAKNVRHLSFGKEQWEKHTGERFLLHLESRVEGLLEGGVDVLLYQAGADPHIDDPLGGFLTSQQLRLRDRAVFQVADEYGVKVVWNLAGGYQKDFSRVLAIHNATMDEAIDLHE